MSTQPSYYCRYIRLYPPSDPGQWPYPIYTPNEAKFKAALAWLAGNNICTIGKVRYDIYVTQTVMLKFRNELDLSAFTLQFGDLFD